MRTLRTSRAALVMALLVARVPDRAGQPLGVPVTAGERIAGNQRWITADLVLAPLAPGDYAVEIRTIGPAGESGVVTALRIVR